MKIKLAIFALFAACIISAEGFTQEKDTTPNLSGSWSGNWISDGSGHKGPMKATFRSTGNDSYEVTFSGRFLRLFLLDTKRIYRLQGKMETNLF